MCTSFPKKQVWILMHYLLCVELFFSKQYNKSALLCFLLAVWNCIMCTPCTSSPSKKAKEANGDEQSSPATARLHDYSFATASCSFFSVPSCFQVPLHPTVPWVSGSKFTIADVKDKVWPEFPFVFFSFINSRLYAQRHLFNPQPFWWKPPEHFQVSPARTSLMFPSTSLKQALETPKSMLRTAGVTLSFPPSFMLFGANSYSCARQLRNSSRQLLSATDVSVDLGHHPTGGSIKAPFPLRATPQTRIRRIPTAAKPGAGAVQAQQGQLRSKNDKFAVSEYPSCNGVAPGGSEPGSH